MRKYLLSTAVLCLLLPFIAYSWMGPIMVGCGNSTVTYEGSNATCDDCTGTLALSWPVEGDNTTAALDVTNGVAPACGCSNGDEIATLQSDAVIAAAPTGKSGYALHVLGAWDGAEFDIAAKDLFDDTAGTITFDFYVVTWVDGTHLNYEEGQANDDFVRIYMSGADEVGLKHEGNATGEVTVVTSGANCANATWYSVTAKWRTGATDPSLYIEVNSVNATSNTDLTAFANDPSLVKWGRSGSADYYIKNMKIYKAWQ